CGAPARSALTLVPDERISGPAAATDGRGGHGPSQRIALACVPLRYRTTGGVGGYTPRAGSVFALRDLQFHTCGLRGLPRRRGPGGRRGHPSLAPGPSGDAGDGESGRPLAERVAAGAAARPGR